jgi:hypothetical protein
MVTRRRLRPERGDDFASATPLGIHGQGRGQAVDAKAGAIMLNRQCFRHNPIGLDALDCVYARGEAAGTHIDEGTGQLIGAWNQDALAAAPICPRRGDPFCPPSPSERLRCPAPYRLALLLVACPCDEHNDKGLPFALKTWQDPPGVRSLQAHHKDSAGQQAKGGCRAERPHHATITMDAKRRPRHH